MIVEVVVKPGSKKGPKVEKTMNGLTVFLREKPVDGEANAALIRILSEHFHIPKTRISIKTGSRGRHKLVEVDEISYN